MPDLGQFITTAATLFSLLTGAGLALQRGIVIGLRERGDDQEKRINDLKDERAEDKAEIIRQSTIIVGLEEKVHTLSSVVTGEVYWKAINEATDHMLPMLEEIRSELRRLK